MLAHIPVYPFATTVYLVFWVAVCVGSVLADRYMRQRSWPLSVAVGFAFAAGFFYLIQYSNAGEWPWTQFSIWLQVREIKCQGGEWLDCGLVVPYVVKWYLLPIYTSSLIVRVVRKLYDKPSGDRHLTTPFSG